MSTGGSENSKSSRYQGTLICELCSEELVDIDLRGGVTSLRCAGCGTVSLDDSQTPVRQKAARLGKFAAIFGILSILFSVLTCIPAIYFATKCLRMKQSLFRKPSGRTMALIGIWTSVIFTPISACCISMIGFTSYIAMISTRTEDPAEIAKLAQRIGAFNLGDAWSPRKGQTVLGSRSVQYIVVTEKNKNRNVNAVVEFSEHTSFPPVSVPQIINQARMRSLANTGHLSVKNTETLNWEIAGSPRVVLLDRGQARNKDMIRFISVITISDKKYSIIGVSRLDAEGNAIMPLEQFRRIFESFQPGANVD